MWYIPSATCDLLTSLVHADSVPTVHAIYIISDIHRRTCACLSFIISTVKYDNTRTIIRHVIILYCVLQLLLTTPLHSIIDIALASWSVKLTNRTVITYRVGSGRLRITSRAVMVLAVKKKNRTCTYVQCRLPQLEYTPTPLANRI